MINNHSYILHYQYHSSCQEQRTQRWAVVLEKCVMTRAVNLHSVFICGQQWNQVICSQWPSKSFIQMTRTVKLPRIAVLKSVQWDQCSMVQNVNLPNVCICRHQQYHNLSTRWVSPRNVKWNLKGHYLFICSQCQILLANRLGHNLE